MGRKRRRSPPVASTAAVACIDDAHFVDGDGEVSFNLPPAAKRIKKAGKKEEDPEEAADVVAADEEEDLTPAPRRSPNGFLLPDPIPAGFKLTDNVGGRWRVGGAIGLGGFGEIYAASKECQADKEDFVVKVEPHSNGPLFVEIAFYLNAGRADQLDSWKRDRGLDHVGVAHFVASGSLVLNGKKFRFLVLPRLGTDLQTIMDASATKAFSVKTACSLATQVIDALEYIHSRGYIHKDVKGSNILFGRSRAGGDRVTLVDFGLCSKYVPGGLHKPFSPDRRWAHEGTLEYTSRDCHLGCFSRRGDIEVTLYNLVEWLGGRLPWEDWQDVKPTVIQEAKIRAYADVTAFLSTCFGSANLVGRGKNGGGRRSRRRTKPPAFLSEMMTKVAEMSFDEEPDYRGLKLILAREMRRVDSALRAEAGDESADEVTFDIQLHSEQNGIALMSPSSEESEGEEAMTASAAANGEKENERPMTPTATLAPGRSPRSSRRIKGDSPNAVADADGNAYYVANGNGAVTDNGENGTFGSLMEEDEPLHAVSAANYKRLRRDSFRRQAEESMRNPTPAMSRQARAIAERAKAKAGGSSIKASRRATPNKWRNLTPSDLTPEMRDVIERRKMRMEAAADEEEDGSSGSTDDAEEDPSAKRTPPQSRRRKLTFGRKKKSSPQSATKALISSGRKRQLKQLKQLRHRQRGSPAAATRGGKKQLLTRSHSVPIVMPSSATTSSFGYIVDAGMGIIKNLFPGFGSGGGSGSGGSGTKKTSR